MDWSGNAVIGFKAGDDFFQNHPFSGSNASFIACQNSPDHSWSNVIYQLRKMILIVHFQCAISACVIDLSAPMHVHLHADLKELRFLTLGSTSGVMRTYLQPSDDGASTTITIPGGFKFGNTTQTSVYVRI